MAFDIVTTVALRPDGLAAFQEQVTELASRAAKKNDPWRWTAHQTQFGQELAIHFVTQAETFEQIQSLGTIETLWTRVLGDAKGREAMLRANASLQSVQSSISIARPDLSYAEGLAAPAEYPYAAVTTARARPGQAEACEELIRKLAEAIPKVGEPTRMLAYQVLFGELGGYWSVRPLRSLAELDRQRPAPTLLSDAFGSAEGGLLWRTGSEAIEQARREIVRLVAELSNPPQG
jgi:hypothetical protein